MATRKTSSNKSEDLKPGSNPQDAAKVGGKGDFGVPEGDVVGRTYTSRNTKASDPGAAQARSGENDDRTSGAGGSASGVGSSSGGDIDTDIVGVGGTGNVSASGATGEHTPGPDDSDGTSNEFASGPPAEGRNQKNPRPERVKGSTVQLPDERTLQGSADDASGTNPTDAAAGEITSGEASGGDNSPSDRQG
jgi:hypothetical protein